MQKYIKIEIKHFGVGMLFLHNSFKQYNHDWLKKITVSH